ncbi:hypothetical protein B0J12DRAFT_691822 [Macrophomina phaseolina]|uniref:Short-chain dehydrogenase/reductase SDR n=1 Tax=Macrophomina phaseolina TaxID=35725 RepID=A0ABQ8FPR9_9PEZI|nr:hypothetical protein B0J12DRAFT_691822 [Macrophomina phaseolina]
MNVNTRGCFNILAEVLRPGVSLKAFKKGSAYLASKHAALALINSAALEVAERGIRVNSVLCISSAWRCLSCPY